MKYTFVFSTCRKEPRFDWYCDGLVKQLDKNNIINYEIIFVDGMLENNPEDRRKQLDDAVRGRFKFIHVNPKPCIWQGFHRLTNHNYHAMSNARNTALCYATGEHVVFTDDCGAMCDDWLSYHIEAAKRQIVFGGMQNKCTGMVVEDGVLLKYDMKYKDSRQVVLGNDTIDFEIKFPEWFYTSNCSLPLEYALEVNGFEEKLDGQIGAEDGELGVRLANAGHPTYINTKCIIYESEEDHSSETLINAKNTKNGANGKWANEQVIIDAVNEKRRWTIGNTFNLRELRQRILSGGTFDIPTEPKKDWRGGEEEGLLYIM